MEKIIELKPLCEMGKGIAKVTPDGVKIEVQGVIGSMKAWLVGGEEPEKIGNLVEGKLARSVDTTRHNGILITQNGRQIFMGAYAECIVPTPAQEPLPFEERSLKWQKMTEKTLRWKLRLATKCFFQSMQAQKLSLTAVNTQFSVRVRFSQF